MEIERVDKNTRSNYVMYKRLTSDLKTDLKWKDGKIQVYISTKQKSRVAMLILDKIDFKLKRV